MGSPSPRRVTRFHAAHDICCIMSGMACALLCYCYDRRTRVRVRPRTPLPL